MDKTEMSCDEQILFQTQSTYKIGAATYQVTAHFNDEEDIVVKLRRLLKDATKIELSQPRQPSGQHAIMEQ